MPFLSLIIEKFTYAKTLKLVTHAFSVDDHRSTLKIKSSAYSIQSMTGIKYNFAETTYRVNAIVSMERLETSLQDVRKGGLATYKRYFTEKKSISLRHS